MNSKWNRCYRLIWSESSREWVVADELSSAGGKGKSRGLVSSILCAALVAGGILAGGSAPALADSCPTTNTTISGTVTTQCLVTATDKVTVTSTGTINKGTIAANIVSYTILVDASGTGVTIDNSGKILHTSLPAIMVNTNARGTKITNQTGGLISVTSSSAIWFNTNSFDAGSVLTNNGTIKVNGTATSSATGIRIAGPLAGTLSNTGTISALAQTNGRTPSAIGINVSGDISGTLNNSGTISATAIEDNTNSSTATAIGISATSLSGSLTVTSTGTVKASATVISSNTRAAATGIKIGTLSVGGKLTNNGNINATGKALSFKATSVIGIKISTSLAGTLTNTGTVSAKGTGKAVNSESATGINIQSMAAGGVLNNSGTISATVSQVANIATAYSLHVLASPGGTINNQGGGVLKGNITVVGSAAVNNAGTIEIPDGVTTANIAGNYTQQAGGKLRIGASSATSFAKLTVGGTANLTGSGVIDVNVAASNTLASGDTLTGVLNPGRGAGTVTGTVTATDNSLWLDFTPSIVGARVDLNVVRAPSVVLKSVQATGFTPGTGAATVFDKLIAGGTTGDMSTVITALKTLNTQQQISNAVAQTLPLMTGGSQLASLDITRGISHELEAQLAGMQGMASGDSFLGSGELWIKPFGGKARQGDRTGASGFDANTFGLMVGMDKDVSHTTSLGMAFGWARSNLNSNNNLHSANVNAFNLAISGIYHMDADTFLRFVANGGINTNDGQRTIRFGTLNRIAKSNYNSQTAHVGIESGHSFAMGEHLSLTPSLRADYAVIHDNKYTETGAGALNLIVGSNNTDELLLGGDMKLGYTLTDTTIFTVNVGAAYDALQNQTLITSSFAGATGSSFTTAGINPPRWLGRGGANLNFKAGNNINVIAAYDGEVRKSFFNQTGSIKLVMTF